MASHWFSHGIDSQMPFSYLQPRRMAHTYYVWQMLIYARTVSTIYNLWLQKVPWIQFMTNPGISDIVLNYKHYVASLYELYRIWPIQIAATILVAQYSFNQFIISTRRFPLTVIQIYFTSHCCCIVRPLQLKMILPSTSGVKGALLKNHFGCPDCAVAPIGLDSLGTEAWAAASHAYLFIPKAAGLSTT